MAEGVVTSLVGVYDADGTIIGEVSYWLGARIGRAHCSLCDVTHVMFTERASWREWRQSLTVPFELFHRDDMPADVAAALTALPAVAARTGESVLLVLDHQTLETCDGDLRHFIEQLHRSLASKGLRLPG